MLFKNNPHFLKKRYDKILEYILNIIDTDSMTRYFVSICLAVSILSTFINFSLDTSILLTYTTIGCSIFYGTLLLICRNNKSSKLCEKIIIISVFSTLNIVWFSNGGSLGPTIIIFHAILPIFLFLIRMKHKGIIIIILWLNMFVLFLVELYYPHLIIGYSSLELRFYDVFIVFIVFLSIEIPILYVVKKHLMREQEKAKRSEKIISAFLTNMSHEVRTPMNAIIGFSDILMDENIDIENRRLYLNIIKENGNSLLLIINNVVEASKLETNSIEVRIEPFLIKNTFDRLRQKHLSQLPPHKNITIKYKAPDANTLIKSDEKIIFQILSNLIYNAIKYTEYGAIEYGLIEDEANVRLYVSDSGKGISDQAKKEIFNRFSIGDSIHSSNNNGVGLGLAICKELTILLEGEIELDSSLDNGSTFYIVLKK